MDEVDDELVGRGQCNGGGSEDRGWCCGCGVCLGDGGAGFVKKLDNILGGGERGAGAGAGHTFDSIRAL